jgi:serpin B
MNTRKFGGAKVALLCILAHACALLAPASAMATETPTWIAQANNAFALDLYGRLTAGSQGNLFFSPNSIETALAMTYAGARGDTASQMAAVLHLPATSDAVHKDLGDFLKTLNGPAADTGKPRGYTLTVANALWAQQGYSFLPAFINLVQTNYGAGLQTVDFVNNTEAARQTINAWIEKKTHGKITNLIPQGALTELTRLVLTNAIYFKGSWAYPFDKAATNPEPFHVSASEDKSVPMMHRTGEYGYTETDTLQALQLRYAGGDLSMIILLPKQSDGLPSLEKQLTPAELDDLLGNLDDQKVIVSIPRFKLTEQFELGPVLQSLGMVDAFGVADFSGMDGKRDIGISSVIHKAFVDVNEEGTEAAAATAVAVAGMAMGMEPPTPVFRADHPFLFLIRDEKSGAILFMGRYVKPEQS